MPPSHYREHATMGQPRSEEGSVGRRRAGDDQPWISFSCTGCRRWTRIVSCWPWPRERRPGWWASLPAPPWAGWGASRCLAGSQGSADGGRIGPWRERMEYVRRKVRGVVRESLSHRSASLHPGSMTMTRTGGAVLALPCISGRPYLSHAQRERHQRSSRSLIDRWGRTAITAHAPAHAHWRWREGRAGGRPSSKSAATDGLAECPRLGWCLSSP